MRGPRAIGILGAGRLGRALATRLRARFEVAVSDPRARPAKQFAKQHQVAFLYERDLAAFADVVLLCVPTDAVAPALASLEASGHRPLCANLATGADTADAAGRAGVRRLRVLPLKLVGQYTAVALGVPATFVTWGASPDEQRVLGALTEPLGRLVTGEGDASEGESRLDEANRLATAEALRLCAALRDRLEALGAGQWADAAIRNVAAGTLMSFPPDPDDAYACRLLEAVAVSAGGRP